MEINSGNEDGTTSDDSDSIAGDCDTQDNIGVTCDSASSQQEKFDDGNSSKSYCELKDVLQCEQIEDNADCAPKPIGLLILAKLDHRAL